MKKNNRKALSDSQFGLLAVAAIVALVALFIVARLWPQLTGS